MRWHTSGSITAYAYDAKNRLIRMTNAAGGVTELQYDAMDRAVQIRYPDGSVEENKYTEAGDLIRAVDPKGNRTDYEYDSLHRLTQTIDPEGVITRCFYDPAGNVTQVMIGGKPVVSRTYNAAGFLTSETDGEGNRSEIHCDGVGNLIRMTDARGHAIQYEYDGCNQLVREINARGKEKSYTYDPTGLLIQETDENGHATDYSYDLSGNLIQIKNAANGILAFEYNSRRQLTAFTDPRGNRTAYTLDPVGQVLETINPMGQKETCAYDSLGNQVEYQDVSGNIVRYTYDPMGRCLSQRDFNNHLSYFAYDKAGNLISQTDRNQHVIHYEYDGLNRLKKVTDPEGGITEYAYHPLGQISDITAFGGGNVRQTTHYEYDSAGRLISEVSPSQAKTGYIYDQAGNPVKKRLPDGNELTYEYDEINRLISADFGDGTKAQYEYDAVGNLTKLQDIRIESGQSKTATEETDFTYDQLNRLIQVTYPNGASAAYEYDANGNKEEITYPDSKAIRYAYDALNRPVNLTDHDGSVIQYEYNPVGTLKRETHENGTTTEYTYDELRRVNGIEETDTHKKRQRLLSYSYDSESNLTGEFRYNVDVDVRDEAVMYSYDQADKLIKTTVGGKTTNYTYDKAGNLIREQKPGEITSYLYDQENRLLSKNGPEGQTSYVYDRTGNLIRQSGSGGTRTFEYDGRGLLTKAANEKGETTEYTYNGLGVRVKNVQVRDNRNTGHRNLRLERGSLYIPDYMPTLIEDRYNWQRVFETEVGTVVQNDREVVEKEYLTDYTSPANRDMLVKEAGSYTQRYLYDLDGRRIRAEFDYAEGTKSGEAGANPASRIAAEQTGKIGYRTSLINSSLYAIKEDGSVISHMIYDEWGNPQTETRQDMNYAGIDNMNNYTGYTYDEVMGIYFAQARFYDPVDKRFIQEDPVKDGSNWYIYCLNNPITLTDILGLAAGDLYINNKKISMVTEMVGEGKNSGVYGSVRDLANAFNAEISFENGKYVVKASKFQFNMNISSIKNNQYNSSYAYNSGSWSPTLGSISYTKVKDSSNPNNSKLLVDIQEFIDAMNKAGHASTIKYEIGDKGGHWDTPGGIRMVLGEPFSITYVPRAQIEEYYNLYMCNSLPTTLSGSDVFTKLITDLVSEKDFDKTLKENRNATFFKIVNYHVVRENEVSFSLGWESYTFPSNDTYVTVQRVGRYTPGTFALVYNS